MDEAHNLRSAIELDDSIVKSFHFQHPDALYEVLTSGLDTSKYVTRELNIEAASDVLKNMLKTEHKRQAQYLLRTLTQWRVFCVIFQDTCDLKFLIANPKTRNLLPKGRLFLFSATRLEEEELEFYCDIPKSILKTVGETETKFIPKDNVAYHYIVCTTDEQKIDLTINALNRTSSPTLILLNNNRNCLKWNDALSKALGERVVLVRSGLNYNERLDAFQEFARGPDKILLSSSNVYWEGITIKELKLLIIPNIPFPQPTLLELAEGKNPEYLKIAKRRLIQGIGRIGRAPQTKGTCILLFQPPKSLSYFKEASIDQALSSIN
jgi:superfamily II DNA/RNA helicase